jgi:hypothetical protein
MTIRNVMNIALTVAVFAAVANAQTPNSAAATGKANTPSRLQHTSDFPLLQESSIGMILNAASEQISRHYDLTPEQSAFAKKSLEDNVFNFVNKHFDTLSSMIPKMIEYRTAQREPTVEEMTELANQVAPMVKEGIGMIVSQNEEFDKVLNDEQRAKHARDVAEMKKDFERATETLERWQKGGYVPGELRNAANQQREERRKRREQRKQDEQAAVNYEPTSLSYWELYLKTFIEAYQLNQGQKTFAYSIFAEARTKAQAYRKDHNAEIEATQSAITSAKVATASAPTDKAKLNQLKELQKKLDTLNQPLMAIFEEMQEKLMTIPTPEQMDAADKASEIEQQATSSAPTKK